MPDKQGRVKISTAHIHQALGLFVAAFEQYCDSMRRWYGILLKRRGIHDYDMGYILLYQSLFTAYPLNECLRAAFRHLYRSHDQIIKEADSIHRIFQDIIKARNDIVHGQTVFYSSIETDGRDPDHVLRQLADVGSKRKVGSKEGVTREALPDVSKVVQLTRELYDLDRRLTDLIFATGDLQMEQRTFLGQKY